MDVAPIARTDRTLAARALLVLALAGLCVGAGCEPERRLVRWDPMLGNLPGAESGRSFRRDMPGYVDPTNIPVEQLVIEEEPGKKTLIAKTGRHLMMHIYNTLAQDDRALFTEQVLSEITRREYRARGLDPVHAFDALKKRRSDIEDLFNAMPAGEYTPGVFTKPVGSGVQRIEVTGAAARGLAWTGMDFVMEKGNYRLRWFVSPAR